MVILVNQNVLFDRYYCFCFYSKAFWALVTIIKSVLKHLRTTGLSFVCFFVLVWLYSCISF